MLLYFATESKYVASDSLRTSLTPFIGPSRISRFRQIFISIIGSSKHVDGEMYAFPEFEGQFEKIAFILQEASYPRDKE